MKRATIYLFVTTLLAILSGCQAFDYHPYDGRIRGDRDINRRNIERIEAHCAGKSVIRFAFVTDTQRAYDETRDFTSEINKRNDIDFVLHGGDISDFGATKEFIWQRDIMNLLKVPYIVVIGNHDSLGNGEDIFQAIFGEPNFAFMVSDIKFVCLNTNAIEYDYSRPIPDFGFIRKQYEELTPGHERTVVVMHARPFSEQFNNNVSYVFQHELNRLPGLQFCVNGHDHNVKIDDLFDDGIIYYGCPNVKDRVYYIFTMYQNGELQHEIIHF